jgi:uncharacterized membrane protein YkgB
MGVIVKQDKRDMETSAASFIVGIFFVVITCVSFDGININAITIIAAMVSFGVSIATLGRVLKWWDVSK